MNSTGGQTSAHRRPFAGVNAGFCMPYSAINYDNEPPTAEKIYRRLCFLPQADYQWVNPDLPLSMAYK